MFIRLEKKLIIVSRLSTGTELSEKEKFVFFLFSSHRFIGWDYLIYPSPFAQLD